MSEEEQGVVDALVREEERLVSTLIKLRRRIQQKKESASKAEMQDVARSVEESLGYRSEVFNAFAGAGVTLHVPEVDECTIYRSGGYWRWAVRCEEGVDERDRACWRVKISGTCDNVETAMEQVKVALRGAAAFLTEVKPLGGEEE